MKSLITLIGVVLWLSLSAQEIETHYEVYGEGFPILLINGGPGFSSEGFRGLAKKLAVKNSVIIYDQRGTGQTPLPDLNEENITLDLMTQDIEKLRQNLEIDEWVVMGHSFGGMLGSYYVSKHPEKVTGLILSSSGGLDLSILGTSLINERLTSIQRDSLSFWSRKIREGDTTAFARLQRATWLAPAYLEKKHHVPVVAERLTQGDLALNSLVWRNMRSIDYDLKERMAMFEKPVLILHGVHDVVDPASAKEAHAIFPHSKLVMMPECSHYGWLDRPDLYFPAIFDFLDQFS
ncbi:alpha/beta fold hydrolase [Portibacter marinus]|uniref:alpha/beta fold hydrolase n=1 Tax=Portibacter marinus TaxID=2898660 RepID=UPI001F286611|nr:alpha/beta fold hydrolase [Portibacter marinus]